MKFITILSVIISMSSFAQTHYNVQFNQTGISGKMVLSGLETSIPDMFNRRVTELGIEFGTVSNYQTEFILQALNGQGIVNPFVSTDRIDMIDMNLKVGGTNCEQAMQLCSNSAVPGNSSGAGTQELNAGNRGCLSTEHQSSWYYLNVLTPGNLIMRINPDDNNDDYDFAVWGPFTAATAGANCPPVTSPIRCSFSATDGNTGMNYGAGDNSEDASGDKWVNPIAVTTGQVYIVLIDNFSTSSQGYNIQFSWGGNLSTAVLGCTPVVLPVEISAFEGHTFEGANIITWSTESELNNDYFLLEWSSTGLNEDWKVIQKTEGAGDSQLKLDYSFAHDDFRQGTTNYYRLTQVDFNGEKKTLEKTVAVNNTLETREIKSVVNLLGQEVSLTEKGIIVILYSDGSKEKRFNAN